MLADPDNRAVDTSCMHCRGGWLDARKFVRSCRLCTTDVTVGGRFSSLRAGWVDRARKCRHGNDTERLPQTDDYP